VGLAAQQPAVTVSAAISLTDALTAIAERYGSEARGSVRFNFAASNTLARQIVNGAPVGCLHQRRRGADGRRRPRPISASTQPLSTCSAHQLAVVVPQRSPAHVHGDPRDRDAPSSSGSRLANRRGRCRPASNREGGTSEGSLWAAVEIAHRADGQRAARRSRPVDPGAADAAIVYQHGCARRASPTVAWVVSVERGAAHRLTGANPPDVAPPDEAPGSLGILRGGEARRVFERFGFARAVAAAPR
jgi:molybdate transport system substrate-binding protein